MAGAVWLGKSGGLENWEPPQPLPTQLASLLDLAHAEACASQAPKQDSEATCELTTNERNRWNHNIYRDLARRLSEQELANVYHDKGDVVLLGQRGGLPGAYLREHLLR